jgi:hypothetical protein
MGLGFPARHVTAAFEIYGKDGYNPLSLEQMKVAFLKDRSRGDPLDRIIKAERQLYEAGRVHPEALFCSDLRSAVEERQRSGGEINEEWLLSAILERTGWAWRTSRDIAGRKRHEQYVQFMRGDIWVAVPA